MKKLACLALFTLAMLAAGCQGRQPVTIGNPAPADRNYKEVSPGKLNLMFSLLADNYVIVEMEFGSRLQSTPLPGYRTLVARHEYGNYYVLVREGLYEEEIKRLKKNQTFRVCGVVTAAQLPTDPQAKITIQVDQ